MLSEFLQGMLLGFGAAVPLGPINILIMNESLKRYRNGVAVGFGAMSADVTYLMIILFGLTHYINNETVLRYFSLFGGTFLIYMAMIIFKNRNGQIKKVNIDQKGSLFKHYIKGYFLTIFSPYTIVFWLSVTTFSTQSTQPLYTVSGMLLAILLWITVMPYFIHKSKHLVSQNIYSKIALISAFILGLFGIVMLVKEFF